MPTISGTTIPRRKVVPLVLSMHGGAMWPAAQKETSQWNRLAEDHGFIVVYPSGETGGGPRVWNVNSGAGLATDVRFISELIDTLMTDYNIDPTRIYANGLSNGGGMSPIRLFDTTVASRGLRQWHSRASRHGWRIGRGGIGAVRNRSIR